MARRYFLRCFRVAREHGVRDVKARSLHDLCALAFEGRKPEEVIELGRRALKTFGPNHPQVPALASDLAWYWMIKRGAYERALPIFQQLLNHIWETGPRLQVMANIARAAGGAGREDVFSEASSEVWQMLEEDSGGSGHAAALSDVAHGAIHLRRWDDASSAATVGLRVARRRREGKWIVELEELLGRIEREDSGASNPAPSQALGLEEELAGSLVEALA
jgi:hypothetical protein